jgi:hypothetical protein
LVIIGDLGGFVAIFYHENRKLKNT